MDTSAPRASWRAARVGPLFLPNAWDYASAAALVHAGYPVIGTTSLGVAASAAKADASGETREETVELTRRLAHLRVMVTVDIESGFSDDAEQVADLAEELADAGAVGINVEDGRPDGTLASVDLHCAKIAAIKARTPDLFVNARTDTFWNAEPGAPPATTETLRRASALCGRRRRRCLRARCRGHGHREGSQLRS